ncbi:hypothetical protein Adt_14050 [Abeliophyllum distichum]|uniref:Uncharacterized protein n=1 Tax=Abeliophyllum distichum TaxID=126358 RepID=A0ABD1TZ51_9LAMI
MLSWMRKGLPTSPQAVDCSVAASDADGEWAATSGFSWWRRQLGFEILAVAVFQFWAKGLHPEIRTSKGLICNSSASTISANINSIPMLNGSNFKDWKENVLIVLGYMDLDLAIRIEKPASLTDESSLDDRRNFEKWERSNRMSLMIIKRGIPETLRGAVCEEVTNAKEFLAEIEKRFAKNDKAETSTLLQSLISMKYKSKGNIREYIMQMSHTASKLKALKLDLSDDLLVHLVLISLPAHFNQFKVSYNCQKEKWTLNDLISYCVQEEERLK